MAVAQNVTSFSHAVMLYEKNFNTHPFWYLFAGKNTNAAARISSWEILGERDDVKQHVETIQFAMEGYGDGYYTLLTRKKPTDTASQQLFLFKKGDGFDGEMDFGIGKIAGMGTNSNNPMQMLMMQAMIKGLNQDSNAAVVGIQKEMELLKMQFEHQKELERLQNGVGPRIMGLIENNFDAILGKLPNLELPKVKHNMPAPTATTPAQSTTTQQPDNDVPKGRAMHELPLEYQPNKISADAMVHYAKEFSKHHPDVNPSILFAKVVAFAAAQPDMARGLFSQLNASVGEGESDE